MIAEIEASSKAMEREIESLKRFRESVSAQLENGDGSRASDGSNTLGSSVVLPPLPDMLRSIEPVTNAGTAALNKAALLLQSENERRMDRDRPQRPASGPAASVTGSPKVTIPQSGVTAIQPLESTSQRAERVKLL